MRRTLTAFLVAALTSAFISCGERPSQAGTMNADSPASTSPGRAGAPTTSPADKAEARSGGSDSIRASVVKVFARECSTGNDASATGFVWGNGDQVVTAMHSVLGCNRIDVYYEVPGASRRGTVVKVLKRADLALLKVIDSPEPTVLAAASTSPGEAEEVRAIGYYLDIPTSQQVYLRLGFLGKQLKDIIPAQVKRDLQALGHPDVDLDIINLQGNLLPGMSGGPILNAAGRLVAVVNGGLKNGTVSASWGIPIRFLEDLARSEETPTRVSRRRIDQLFATTSEEEAGEAIRCGDLSFQPLGTRSFAEIASSTDDPRGLHQLLSVLGLSAPSFEAAIYQELESGATFAVPGGLPVESQATHCTVSAGAGLPRLDIQGFRLAADPTRSQRWMAEVQEATTAFEDQVLPDAPYWQMDPQWSYWQPQFRYDGFVVRRKAAALYRHQNPWNLPTQYAFETLIARGPAGLGVAARQPQNVQFQLCILGYETVGCPSRSEMETWAQFILLTHLATFPPN